MTSRAGEPARAPHLFTSGGRPPGLAGASLQILNTARGLGKRRANSKALRGVAGSSEDDLERGGAAGADPVQLVTNEGHRQVAPGPLGVDPTAGRPTRAMTVMAGCSRFAER